MVDVVTTMPNPSDDLPRSDLDLNIREGKYSDSGNKTSGVHPLNEGSGGSNKIDTKFVNAPGLDLRNKINPTGMGLNSEEDNIPQSPILMQVNEGDFNESIHDIDAQAPLRMSSNDPDLTRISELVSVPVRVVDSKDIQSSMKIGLGSQGNIKMDGLGSNTLGGG
ncbi:hypothetical protein Cni_G06946 [Canna indica]|uniref:Uncharacterized protein n=1 Tax=Canna indica TaxID=4628 RepID=A0AAQ3JXY9_9LILI|nr:hypothetical protein Cni_G06946 [Canna indica]